MSKTMVSVTLLYFIFVILLFYFSVEFLSSITRYLSKTTSCDPNIIEGT